MSQKNIPPIRIRIRRQGEAEIAFGPGKADLLDAIESTGSITAAAKAMRMSYKRAWDLVSVMNSRFKHNLVETSQGGSRGGGAIVTEFGKQVREQYRTLEAKAYDSIQTELNALQKLLKKQ